MIIQSVYEKYHIPLNLQTHMYRVAGVGKIICDHVKDVRVNSDLIIKTLLLHDMGNILKFDLSNPLILEGADKNRIDELKDYQHAFRTKYGDRADDATRAILHELSVDPAIISLDERSHDRDSSAFAGSDDWDAQICYYADMRVGPFGLLPLTERFDDLRLRYPGSKTRLEQYERSCKKIEKKLQQATSIDIKAIDDASVEKERQVLVTVDI